MTGSQTKIKNIFTILGIKKTTVEIMSENLFNFIPINYLQVYFL